ncbi:T9SS type A sorting domain-containing protein [Flavobacterium longum]|uniref:DUF7619 domain-containing protein n=1 Tax=Flavobacterium longum TaxID=1299340 RepID=UPI0039EA2172
MRKIYFLLVLVGLSASAQIVNIPDANFKNFLLSNEFDTNGDGEIQESEAATVNYLLLDGLGIVSLEGIQAFTNLHQLSCQSNLLTSLDVSALENLKTLHCDHNQLSTLIFPDHPMQFITISYNQLTNVDLPPLLPFNPNQYYGLDISGNLYTSIDLPEGLVDAFYCDDTLLTSLDLSNLRFNLGTGDFSIAGNQNLAYINLKNGSADYCSSPTPEECSGMSLSIANNPNLAFMCVDNEAEAAHFSNFNCSTYCSFTPGGNYNTITGTIRFDTNGNGCDAGDTFASGIPVNIYNGANFNGISFTDNTGNFTTYTSSGNRTVTPQFENPYYAFSPASFTSAFSGTGNTAVADFCIVPNGVHPDLEISIIPVTVARPGFDVTYKINYENKGTETQSGSVTLTFEDDILDFVSANPTTDSQAANTLSWNFSNLSPFESREIALTLNVNSPLETPAVNIGDILDFTAAVSAGPDETPADNTFEFDHVVVGSFDPNDKAVSRESIGIAQLSDYLYYTVRFQNTGTFYAENVVVKDILSANLDLATLQMVSASHPYRSTLTNTNKLEFFFEGINLPAVGDDEPGSHGYVTFKIKPKNSLVVGNTIANDASIYFDFNAPIATNTVTTTVTALGNPEVAANDFVVYPNPAKHTISIQSDATIESVAIYNTLGQLVKTANGQTTIDVSELSAGSYLIQIVSDKGKATKKLIKI